MIDLNEKYNFPIKQAYGSTETTPLATAAIPKSYMADWPAEKLYDIKTSSRHYRRRPGDEDRDRFRNRGEDGRQGVGRDLPEGSLDRQ